MNLSWPVLFNCHVTILKKSSIDFKKWYYFYLSDEKNINFWLSFCIFCCCNNIRKFATYYVDSLFHTLISVIFFTSPNWRYGVLLQCQQLCVQCNTTSTVLPRYFPCLLSAWGFKFLGLFPSLIDLTFEKINS